jgi:hypothetical protein
VDAARAVVSGTKPKLISTDFAEERDTGLRERLYREFNTLSIIYGQTSEQVRGPTACTHPCVDRPF